MGFFDDIFGQPFGGMFDMNGDGKTDLGEEWLGYMVINECMKEDEEEKFSEEDVEDLKKQIEDLESQVANYKENNKKLETIKSLKEKIANLTDEVATFKEKAEGKEEIEKELEAIKLSIKRKEYDDFIEKQIDKGILIPANKDIVLSVLQELDNIKKFGEDSAVVSDFKSFIESLPKQVTFDEVATKDKQSDAKNDVEKFALDVMHKFQQETQSIKMATYKVRGVIE